MKKFFNVFTILIIVFIFRSPLKDISNNLISYVQGNVNNIINKIDNEDEYINNSAIGERKVYQIIMVQFHLIITRQ